MIENAETPINWHEHSYMVNWAASQRLFLGIVGHETY